MMLKMRGYIHGIAFLAQGELLYCCQCDNNYLIDHIIKMRRKQDEQVQIMLLSEDFTLKRIENCNTAEKVYFQAFFPTENVLKAEEKKDKSNGEKLFNTFSFGGLESWIEQRSSLYQYLASIHVAKLFRSISMNNGAMFILEDTQMLFSDLPKKNLTYTQKVIILESLASNIKFLQTMRVVMRNLRPETVGVNQNGKYEYKTKLIVLKDLIQLPADKNYLTEHPIYHSRYLSPEIRNRETYGAKSDVWTLGVMFYQLLFGDKQIVRCNHEKTIIKFPEGTPAWLCQIFQKMTAYNPKDRYSPSDALNRIKFLRQCSEAAQKIIPQW